MIQSQISTRGLWAVPLSNGCSLRMPDKQMCHCQFRFLHKRKQQSDRFRKAAERNIGDIIKKIGLDIMHLKRTGSCADLPFSELSSERETSVPNLLLSWWMRHQSVFTSRPREMNSQVSVTVAPTHTQQSQDKGGEHVGQECSSNGQRRETNNHSHTQRHRGVRVRAS